MTKRELAKQRMIDRQAKLRAERAAEAKRQAEKAHSAEVPLTAACTSAQARTL